MSLRKAATARPASSEGIHKRKRNTWALSLKSGPHAIAPLLFVDADEPKIHNGRLSEVDQLVESLKEARHSVILANVLKSGEELRGCRHGVSLLVLVQFIACLKL